MSWLVDDLVTFIGAYIAGHPGTTKSELEKAASAEFGLLKDRAVYHGPHFSIRFSSASGKGFSNTVASLALVQKYDKLPFLVCVVRPGGFDMLLANSTLLRKISHSSHRLAMDNIRGSFLGHDIQREFSQLLNTPENFEALFEMHLEFDWEENLSRLVEATTNITSMVPRYEPSEEEVSKILSSAELSSWLSDQDEYKLLAAELNGLVDSGREAILAAASIENVNIRGNAIEQILTSAGNLHSLHDFSRSLVIGLTVAIDIKTKLLALKSSPKGYNIDKFLRTLASGTTVFAFYLLGIDLENERIQTRLVSALDEQIIDLTRIQFHWAGRKSRGVTQLTGNLAALFTPGRAECIDVPRARSFLRMLIDLTATQ